MGKIILAEDSDKIIIRDAFNNAITDLEMIQNFDNPTTAQLEVGIKKTAGIVEKLLRFVYAKL